MISYFVTYSAKCRSGANLLGRVTVDLKSPVRSMSDVCLIEKSILDDNPEFVSVILTGWKRFEEDIPKVTFDGDFPDTVKGEGNTKTPSVILSGPFLKSTERRIKPFCFLPSTGEFRIHIDDVLGTTYQRFDMNGEYVDECFFDDLEQGDGVFLDHREMEVLLHRAFYCK